MLFDYNDGTAQNHAARGTREQKMPPVQAELDAEEMLQRVLPTMLRYILSFTTVYYETFPVGHDHLINDRVITLSIVWHDRNVHLARAFRHMHKRIA